MFYVVGCIGQCWVYCLSNCVQHWSLHRLSFVVHQCSGNLSTISTMDEWKREPQHLHSQRFVLSRDLAFDGLFYYYKGTLDYSACMAHVFI